VVSVPEGFAGGIEVSYLFRNLRVVKQPRKVWPSIMKAFLWVTKFAWKSPVVGDVSQNSVEIRVHVSSAGKWVIGLGEHEFSVSAPAPPSALIRTSRECPNHVVQSVLSTPLSLFPHA
jgi:hypothetical protein